MLSAIFWAFLLLFSVIQFIFDCFNNLQLQRKNGNTCNRYNQQSRYSDTFQSSAFLFWF